MFPEQAATYVENPDGITWRVKKVLAVALNEGEFTADGEDPLPEVSTEEVWRRGHEYLATIHTGRKTMNQWAVHGRILDKLFLKFIQRHALLRQKGRGNWL